MDFSEFGQGEYVGPHRLRHVNRYRMRVDDQVRLVYRLTRELDRRHYKFNVGDEVLVEGENLTGNDADQGGANLGEFNRNMVILPDGTITIPYIGQVRAAGRTVQQLRNEVQDKSKEWFKFPMWTITPLRVNTRLEDLRAVVDARAGQGGQSITLRVSPDGTIQPPAIAPVCVQGLTLEEAKFEIDQRYTQAGFRGIEVSTILTDRAPSFIYVLGEVRQPGRFTLERPTTVMGAISLAGGWNIGGNLRQIIVFRRADDWRLVATRINLQGALMGKHPTPADEIFLRDSDIVLVPKSPIQRIDDAINLVFTQGVNPLITFGSAAGFLDLTFAN
jgi:polysaccharide export outer membrane protein